jgi:type VI secretion system protein ImpG
MFNKHHQSELTFLRAMGSAFAETHPESAGLLAGRGNDPDVERLLEGFAFLTARIRGRIEDGVPEVVHDLAELLLPHYLRPLPATSIVEFLPMTGALRSRSRVAAGTELESVPVEGTACQFCTTADLDLVPAAVEEVTVDRSIGANPVLRVRLRVAPQGLPAVFAREGLRFFVHGELPVASTLVLWLARHLRGIEVRSLAPGGGAVQLGPGAVSLAGFDPALPLLPWPRLAPAGYRTLQEYFTLPQKFHFIDVRGLDAAAAVSAERFELAFQLERPPELPGPVPRDAFRLNCVPVVNVFPVAADPISVRGLGDEHLVRGAALPPGHMSVYAVGQVTGIPEGAGARVAYEPFSAFSHGARDRGAAYYRLRRSLSPVDGELDTWISLSSPQDGGPGPASQTLSLAVSCTNRALPARLKLGDVCRSAPTSPTVARFRNIVPVSRPVRPPLGSDLHWRLIAHLATQRDSTTTVEGLRRVLELYNFQELGDAQAGRANRLRVEAIQEMDATPTRRLVQGAPVRGTHVSLRVDEAGFAGAGDAFLFASAIDELFAGRASLGSFTELGIALEPSRREYAWKPRNGRRVLL